MSSKKIQESNAGKTYENYILSEGEKKFSALCTTLDKSAESLKLKVGFREANEMLKAAKVERAALLAGTLAKEPETRQVYPVVFSSHLMKGEPLESRTYLMDADRQPSYTKITKKMKVQDIFDLARKVLGIQLKSIRGIGCWNRDGSLFTLNSDGTNLPDFRKNLAEHNAYMEESLGREMCEITGENAALVMVDIKELQGK